jgi:hypothetical protein
MLDIKASAKWAESLINRIKGAQDDKDFPVIRKVVESQRDDLMEPRYVEIVEWWVNFRQRDFNALKRGAIGARKRLDAALSERSRAMSGDAA